MGRRFQSGHAITFPVPTVLNATDGGPRTVLVVGKCNTSAYQAVLYTRSSGAHGWWVELDTTGGLHQNYGTGTTARNVGTVGTTGAELWASWKDNGGTFHPFGRRFSGASFATDSGDVDSGATLVDGTAIDTSWGLVVGRWGNTGSDYSGDLEIYYIQVSNSVISSASIAAAPKTKAGLQALGFDYWMSFEGSTVTDSAGGTPTISGTTTVSDPAGFFGSGGLTQALPVASRTAVAVTLARSKRRALPPASRTAAAVTLTPSKRRLVPVAARTAVVPPVVASKRRALLVAAPTHPAVAFGRLKVRALPSASRTAVAVAVVTSKRRALPVGVRTAVAGGMGNGGIIKALPVASRTSVATAVVGSKRAELPPATRYSTAVLLAGGTPEGSGAMILGDVMDEMAARLRLAPSLAGRTFAYPPGSIKAPAAIVTYPPSLAYDKNYRRGMDRITGEVVVVVGRPTERQTRDRITKYADGSGPESVKALLDGDAGDYASCDSVTVTEALFDAVTIGGVDYLAAVFSVDIVGRGATP